MQNRDPVDRTSCDAPADITTAGDEEGWMIQAGNEGNISAWIGFGFKNKDRLQFWNQGSIKEESRERVGYPKQKSVGLE